jgi:hypothetical protein
MKQLQLPRVILALLIGCALSTSLLHAGEIIPPTNLRVAVAVDESSGSPLYTATFEWKAASSFLGRIHGYRLYAKQLGDQSKGEFVLLASSAETKLTVTQNDIDICCTAHSFRITAFIDLDESDPSNVVSTVCGRDFNDGDFEKYVGNGATRFVTTPPTKAQIGEPYRYDAGVATEVGSSDHSNLEYSLMNGPAGMAVDARSGVVTWVPDTPGSWFVTVRAALNDGTSSDQQSWRLDVAGSVAGVPNPEAGWSVRLYPNPATASMTVTVPELEHAREVAFVDMRGRTWYSHSIDVGDWSREIDLSGFPAGVYILRLQGERGVRMLPFTVVK